MQISKIILGWLVIVMILVINCNPLPVLAQTGGAGTPTGQESMWLKQSYDNGLNQIGDTTYETKKPKDIREIVVEIIQVVLGLLGIIFVILMILGGWTWMMSQGNDEKVTKARQTILTASIGLLIILASFAITWYISNRIIYSVQSKLPYMTIGP